MSQDDESKQINIQMSDDSESGSGSTGSAIAFESFIAIGDSLRDDLPLEEKRRLRSVHEGAHEAVVKKQKASRDQYKQLKEGKISLQSYRQGLANSSQYKNHPLLSHQAQFSGIDDKVKQLPNECTADINNELSEELRYRYNLTHKPQPQSTPRYVK